MNNICNDKSWADMKDSKITYHLNNKEDNCQGFFSEGLHVLHFSTGWCWIILPKIAYERIMLQSDEKEEEHNGEQL